MFRCLIATTAVLALIGCATNRNPLPPDYSGPKAILRDSVANYDGSKADWKSPDTGPRHSFRYSAQLNSCGVGAEA